jgi:hypothetical protein
MVAHVAKTPLLSTIKGFPLVLPHLAITTYSCPLPSRVVISRVTILPPTTRFPPKKCPTTPHGASTPGTRGLQSLSSSLAVSTVLPIPRVDLSTSNAIKRGTCTRVIRESHTGHGSPTKYQRNSHKGHKGVPPRSWEFHKVPEELPQGS